MSGSPSKLIHMKEVIDEERGGDTKPASSGWDRVPIPRKAVTEKRLCLEEGEKEHARVAAEEAVKAEVASEAAAKPPNYYYMGDQPYMYPWYPMPQQHQMPPQQPQHHPQPAGGHGPPRNGVPVSPRNHPPPFQGPGTPTLTHAASASHPPHLPSTMSHSSSGSIGGLSSPLPSPSSASIPGTGRLNTSASAFMPGKRSSTRVTLKNAQGKEINLENLKNQKLSTALSGTALPLVVSPMHGKFNRRSVIHMESEEGRLKRLAGEREKERAKAKAEADSKAKKEKEENERREKEEKERLEKEREAKAAKEKQEREAAEKERLKKEEEEKEKERLRLEEEERKKAEEETEKKRLQQEQEEKERTKEEAARVKAEAKAAPLPSALATARIIDDLGRIPYPEGIKSPRVELNINAKDGKFRYDRDFLLQFMSICKEKPDSLPALDAIGLEPSDQINFPMSRGGPGRHRQCSGAVPPQRQNTTSFGFNPGSSFDKGGSSSTFSMGDMGNFATSIGGSKLNSDERFCNAVAAPTTIAQIHAAATEEKAAQEKEAYQRQMSMSRGRSRQGGERGEFPQVGADGWAVASGNSAPRPPSKASNLSKFGQIRGAPLTFGPESSIYAGKKDKRESVQRMNSPSLNMFSMLNNDSTAEATPNEMLQRKRLVLAPQPKPIAHEEEHGPIAMTDREAKKRIAEDIKEFSAVRNLDEAEVYFTQLPAKHHPLLVDKLISFAVESNEADAQLVAQLFSRASTKNLCTIADFESGFAGVLEFLDDIAIDAPMAFKLMAIMMKGPAFDDEQLTRLALKTDSVKVLLLLCWTR
ncbi:uncharacterized protein ARMOST_01239 [Armillaria ostoyae]|uniref:MI domain-containing protein n=1 Tax=Armillaria ostoyae TaxID=47428 RepID=A0A284QNE1_ARMOS|nr:uncharacterized protein ARMOST_01239 [Armillaria ostoyae]